MIQVSWLTNDLTGLDAQGWDAGKLMYLKNSPFAWDDSSFDTMYSWIHAYGHFSTIIKFILKQLHLMLQIVWTMSIYLYQLPLL